MILLENEFFTIIEQNDKVYIKVEKEGFDVKEFNNILSQVPRLNFTKFLNLKRAFENCDNQEVEIGNFKPEIEIITSSDEMECRVKLNMHEDYLKENNKEVVTKTIKALNQNGINEGIINDVLYRELTSIREVLIAKGVLPINGEDAIIKLYELSERRPEIRKDGRADFYDLNLIDIVKKGDWLGEKIPATEGQDGKTVTGKIVPAMKGKDKLLRYDTHTVEEVIENEKSVLRAKVDGAVIIENGKVKVDNHLIIQGDVDYSTGSLNFNGFITIKGTVKDGFSVTAKNDISILSDMGIGATGKILSLEGSIYIKGGVNGRGTTIVEAQKDVYTKYCNEAKITAGGKIDIGFYSMDSELTAQRVLLDKKNGRVLGGRINAETQIVAGVVGNKYEKKTEINVNGFDRLTMKKEFQELLQNYKKLLKYAEDLKTEIDIYSFKFSINESREYIHDYNLQLKKYEEIMDEIAELDRKRLILQQTLQSKGEGQISVLRGAFPETQIQIKAIRKRINHLVSGTFFAQGKELHFDEEL